MGEREADAQVEGYVKRLHQKIEAMAEEKYEQLIPIRYNYFAAQGNQYYIEVSFLCREIDLLIFVVTLTRKYQSLYPHLGHRSKEGW